MVKKLDLQSYLVQKFEKESETTCKSCHYITISREVGCSSIEIATELSEELTKLQSDKAKTKPWQWISKELINESAKELDLKPDHIKHVFDVEQRNFLEDIIYSFAGNYAHDIKIKKTVKKVVNDLIGEGNIIIVGRGAVAFTQEKTNGINIKLYAPFEYRVNEIMKAKGIDKAAAEKYVKDLDSKRKSLIKDFSGSTPDHELFDVMINVSRFTTKEIVSSIIGLMDAKGFIK